MIAVKTMRVFSMKKAVDIIENKEEYIETIREAVDKAVKKDEIIRYDTPDYYEKEFDTEDQDI